MHSAFKEIASYLFLFSRLKDPRGFIPSDFPHLQCPSESFAVPWWASFLGRGFDMRTSPTVAYFYTVDITHWTHGNVPSGFVGTSRVLYVVPYFLLNVRVPGTVLLVEIGTTRHAGRSRNWLQLSKKKGKEIMSWHHILKALWPSLNAPLDYLLQILQTYAPGEMQAQRLNSFPIIKG